MYKRQVVNVGASMEGSRRSVSLSEEYEFVYSAVGVHPDEVGELREEDMEDVYKRQVPQISLSMVLGRWMILSPSSLRRLAVFCVPLPPRITRQSRSSLR